MSREIEIEKARLKVDTEMKRHELNKAIKKGAEVEEVERIALEIVSIAKNKFELKDLLDPVGYNIYVGYVGMD